MASKTPIRATLSGSNVTGLAEFQSGEFIPLSAGGIGASLSIGSAGQVLKVNTGASALEFGSVEAIVNIDGATDLESATLAVGDKILLSDGGTEGRVLLSQLDTLFSGTSKTLTNKTINSNANTLHIDLDDLGTFTGSLAEFNAGLQGDSFVSLTGTETLTNKTLTSAVLNTGVSGSAVLDEDNFASNSATKLATQQSIKAYVDSQAHLSLIDEDDMSSDSATRPPSQQSVKAYVDAQEHAVTATSTTTFTNKTLTSPVLNTGVSGSAILDEDAMGSNSATQLATQQSIKAYVDAQILTKDNTDEITEGSNLYFTNARADARITNALKDEDDFASNSATHLASQQSIKAYVDAQTTDEVRQDIIGAMLTGNTETLITVTYQDSDGTVDFVVDNDLANYDNSNSSFITGLSTTTLTNKTFDVDGTGNSLSNIANANIKAAAAIDATKIADGSISNAEYQYLNGVSSNIQTQLSAKATSSQSIAFALALG